MKPRNIGPGTVPRLLAIKVWNPNAIDVSSGDTDLQSKYRSQFIAKAAFDFGSAKLKGVMCFDFYYN